MASRKTAQDKGSGGIQARWTTFLSHSIPQPTDLDRTEGKAYVSGVLVLDRDSHPGLLPETFLRWFAGRGWAPREHQLALLAKAREDRSALLIAPTGAGKTLAGFLPTLVELSSPLPVERGERKLVSTGRGPCGIAFNSLNTVFSNRSSKPVPTFPT